MFLDTHRVRLGQGDFSCFGVFLNDIIDNPNVAPDLVSGDWNPGRLTQGQALPFARKRRTVRAVLPSCVIRAVPICFDLSGDLVFLFSFEMQCFSVNFQAG
jgi:hypothetical protein